MQLDSSEVTDSEGIAMQVQVFRWKQFRRTVSTHSVSADAVSDKKADCLSATTVNLVATPILNTLTLFDLQCAFTIGL